MNDKSLDTVMIAVTEEMQVPIESLKRKTRIREVVDARIMLAVILRNHYGWTHRRIAEVLNRDRSTVIWALKVAEGLMMHNTWFIQRLKNIERRLSS